MWKLLRAAPLILLAPLAGISACASATPKAAEQPGLIVPPPPPHVVPINAEPIAEPVGDIPGTTSAPIAGTSRAPARPTPPKPSTGEARPDPKAGAEAKPPDTPPEPATPPAPVVSPPQLRTTEGSGAEAAVRSAIERTRQILTTVDYRHLTQIRKKAYDDAKKFADQADEALKQGNVVFAQGVAGKAETLAKELAGR
jgi:hypothetical protein